MSRPSIDQRFWRLDKPECEDDYSNVFINGLAEYTYGIPGIDCPRCGPWGGLRTLPVECPAKFRTDRRLANRWPLPVEEHARLCSELETALREETADLVLEPGDSFQPLVFDIPCKPTLDFYWCRFFEPVVARRVRDLFVKHSVTGISFHEVRLRRAGTLPAKSDPPIAETGEPEDIFDAIAIEPHPEKLGPFFETLVDGPLVDADRASLPTCEICGLEKHPEYEGEEWLIKMDEDRPNVMSLSAVRSTDVFRARSVGLVISERVHELVTANSLTNCLLTELELVP